MVLLTVTDAAKAAIEQYCKLRRAESVGLSKLLSIESGDAVDHHDLIAVANYLKAHDQTSKGDCNNAWRLDFLLKGARVYRSPPQPKPEPTTEYKILMRRLREQEEQRVYERMLDSQTHSFTARQQGFNAGNAFYPSAVNGAMTESTDMDDVTFADIKRQMALIVNVLVSIIACSVAIWIGARRWAVPQRLGLSMSGSVLVAVAEVTIYMGYIRRIKEAKVEESKKVERKEVVQTWIVDGASPPPTNVDMKPSAQTMRHRKDRQQAQG